MNQFSKIRDRKSTVGMLEAVVAIYCLADTQKILDSYWSSFPKIAAKIYDSPLFILKKSSL